MKSQELQWERVGSNYDLRLVNGKITDANVQEILERVTKTESLRKHFSGAASKEFERWLEKPGTPLKEHAYARLSNWFLCEQEWVPKTLLGIACGDFWDALFCVRPKKRLTNPDKNYKIRKERFDPWWSEQKRCQGGQ